MAFRNCYFIAKPDIVFLGRLEYRCLSLIMTIVIGCTLPSWDCFTDFHLCYRLSDEVDGRTYFLIPFSSSGILFLSSGMSVMNLLNWFVILLL
jgi:hypothetical protein